MSWRLADLTGQRRTPGQCAMLACVLEATARKPGNVHPDSSFPDLCYGDFLAGAAAIRPVLDRASELGVGRTVLECIRETRKLAASNANLGIVLLLVPMAAVASGIQIESGIHDVLDRLTVEDSRLVYHAIRLAQPGGLGRVPEHDVAVEPTEDLRTLMTLAADRDLVARQYANAYQQVMWGERILAGSAAARLDWEQAIVLCQLELMANYPDSLIARKCGAADATESARRAAAVLAAEWPATPDSRRQLDEFDNWLRADGNQRNPGTTADIIAASLYVMLRDETMK